MIATSAANGHSIPAVLIAGTNSGVGKTTTTVDDRLALRSFKNFLDELHIRIKP